MAIVVVVLPTSEAETTLQPAVVSELARLGITNVALVRDESLIGLVLEGWSFDPARSADAVVAALAEPGSSARTLQPLLQMGISSARERGET